ncbi:maestro heat-like repeat family member 5 [Phaenicophaeus curvirostris]|uniref:maestro heat-like repeat family member 5 n=1 Tax=Phaenicophaeus curvirostris TaxID=33595 RepID=UPI0037F0BF54
MGNLSPADGYWELSKVREQAIVCFREQLKSVVLKDKSLKKSKVRMALVPLLLHLSDETPSVAKASEEALLAAAKFLGWREVQECIRAQQMWRIPECLLAQDQKRAEEYLNESLRYLNDPQDAVQEAAVRFIGHAAQPLKHRKPEKVSEICRALQALTEDSEEAVVSLALQTILILRPSSTPPRRFSALRWLFQCWR